MAMPVMSGEKALRRLREIRAVDGSNSHLKCRVTSLMEVWISIHPADRTGSNEQ